MPDQPADLSNPENWWTVAVRQRAEEAEAKFQRGGGTDPDGVIATALVYPNKYRVVVRLREDVAANPETAPPKWQAFDQPVTFTGKDGTVFTGDGAAVMTYLDDALCQMQEEDLDDMETPAMKALIVLLDNAATLGEFLPGTRL